MYKKKYAHILDEALDQDSVFNEEDIIKWLAVVDLDYI